MKHPSSKWRAELPHSGQAPLKLFLACFAAWLAGLCSPEPCPRSWCPPVGLIEAEGAEDRCEAGSLAAVAGCAPFAPFAEFPGGGA